MADDVVGRMRARADAIAENDAAVIESGGRPNARWYAIETALREGADEIERLRAKAARADGLQALIDAYAVAWHSRGIFDAAGERRMIEARNALLAVATQEQDDRA